MFASLRLSMHAHGLTYVFIIEQKKEKVFSKWQALIWLALRSFLESVSAGFYLLETNLCLQAPSLLCSFQKDLVDGFIYFICIYLFSNLADI